MYTRRRLFYFGWERGRGEKRLDGKNREEEVVGLKGVWSKGSRKNGKRVEILQCLRDQIHIFLIYTYNTVYTYLQDKFHSTTTNRGKISPLLALSLIFSFTLLYVIFKFNIYFSFSFLFFYFTLV